MNDEEVVCGLLFVVEDDFRGCGMLVVCGLYNFFVNDECGMLVDGFDMLLVVLMFYG